MLYRNNPWQCHCIYARNNVQNIILNRLVKLNNHFCILQISAGSTHALHVQPLWIPFLISTDELDLGSCFTLCCTRRELSQGSFCPSVELSERGRDQKLKMLWILVLYIWFRVMPDSCRIYYVFSLRKHPFLFALHRWGRFARRNVCDSATEIPY